MGAITKSSPNIIKRSLKDKKAVEAEYKFAKAIFQLGATKLIEALKNDKILLKAKDLKDIHEIKQQVAIDDLEDSGMYFLECNACLFTKSCSLYETSAQCKFNLKGGELKSSKDIINVMVKLLQIESDRIQRSLLIEKMDGGVDREVSSEIMQYFDMVDRLKNIMSKEESVEIKVKGRGAISQLFGDVIKKSINDEEGTVKEPVEVKQYNDSKEKVLADKEDVLESGTKIESEI